MITREHGRAAHLGGFVIRLHIFMSVIMLFASLKNFCGGVYIPEESLWHLYGEQLKVLVIIVGFTIYEVTFNSSDDF